MVSSYIPISQSQLNNAKIYTNRWAWIDSLPKNLDIIEVGVGSGDYSEHMMKRIQPNSLMLIDQYDQCDPQLARPDKPKRYSEEQHYDFIVNKFRQYDNVEIIKENSITLLPKLVDAGRKFDMIYIDASHAYEDSKEDISNASKLLRQNGILAINDYVSYVQEEKYGVILATNEFLNNNKDWQVIGFALEENMMADIYLSRTVPVF